MSQQSVIRFPLTVIADCLGNADGIAIANEDQSLQTYFVTHPEAWCVGDLLIQYWQAEQIPATDLTMTLQASPLTGPFPSEADLRQAYEKTGIRTPYVAIYRFRAVNHEIELVQYFRAPGGDISHSSWELITLSEP